MKKIILGFVFCLVTSFVQAATITVETENDELDTNGDCSLREAIINSNDNAQSHPDCTAGSSDGSVDTIILPTGEYQLTRTGSGEDLAETGDLDIFGILNISSTGVVSIDANSLNDRIFHVTGDVALTLDNLTLKDATINGTTTGVAGGCIFIEGNLASLTITDSTLTNCRISLDDTSNPAVYTGGAIFSNGSVTLNNVALSNNSVIYAGSSTRIVMGGALYVVMTSEESLNINSCTFSSNSVSTVGTSAYGGAILVTGGESSIENSLFTGSSANSEGISLGGAIVLYNDGSLEIAHSTITLSSAISSDKSKGGGIYSIGASAEISIVNSTITGNSAEGSNDSYGGGIALESSAVLKASFTTINSNTAGVPGALVGTTYRGGGVYGEDISIKNSIIASNTITGVLVMEGPDCYSTNPTLLQNNIFSSVSNCGTPDETNIIVDPLLASLSDNGGATYTSALLTGSSAIDAVTDCTDVDGIVTVDTDQRGAPRTSGDCDIGAYEAGLFYADADEDGFGDSSEANPIFFSEERLTDNTDCDDSNEAINSLATEVCDDVDNDCDGDIDETFTTKGNDCSVGVGECAATGVLVCNVDEDDVECNATAEDAVVEVCDDDLDNDCDGDTDSDDANCETDPSPSGGSGNGSGGGCRLTPNQNSQNFFSLFGISILILFMLRKNQNKNINEEGCPHSIN